MEHNDEETPAKKRSRPTTDWSAGMDHHPLAGLFHGADHQQSPSLSSLFVTAEEGSNPFACNHELSPALSPLDLPEARGGGSAAGNAGLPALPMSFSDQPQEVQHATATTATMSASTSNHEVTATAAASDCSGGGAAAASGGGDGGGGGGADWSGAPPQQEQVTPFMGPVCEKATCWANTT